MTVSGARATPARPVVVVACGGALLACAVLAAAPARADRAQDLQNKTLGLQQGPLGADLGPATLQVSAEQVFTGREGARRWLALTKNPASGYEVGLVGLSSGAIVVVETAPLTVGDDDAGDLAAANPATSVGYDKATHVARWPGHRALLGRKSVVLLTAAGGAADDELAAVAAAVAWKPGEQFDARITDETTKPPVYGLRDLAGHSGLALADKKPRIRLGTGVAIGGGLAVAWVLIAMAVLRRRQRRQRRKSDGA